jgi:ceramide glucosyltransferase
MTVFGLLLDALAGCCLVGALYLVVAAWAVRRFVALPQPHPVRRPAVTVLKPLHGDEPNLYENLRSFCVQGYPGIQVVFGVRNATDPAVTVVERLQADLPEVDIELVVDGRIYGTNFKISNLINMMARAKHDLLVVADSDMRAGPDYLDGVIGPLLDPGIGLVTCLYRGRPVGGTWSQLGAMFINHGFLGQVLVGRLVGADDGCFGATMALGRQTLEQVGGFEAFRDRLADDYALGAAVRALGLRVALSPHIIDTQVCEPDLSTLFRHELRWARTLRSIEPLGYGASIVTHPLPAALLLLLVSGAAPYAVAIFVAILACRMVYNTVTDSALAVPSSASWLMPVRDLVSVAVLIASFCGTSVTWREQKFRVAADGQLTLDGDLRQ